MQQGTDPQRGARAPEADNSIQQLKNLEASEPDLYSRYARTPAQWRETPDGTAHGKNVGKRSACRGTPTTGTLEQLLRKDPCGRPGCLTLENVSGHYAELERALILLAQAPQRLDHVHQTLPRNPLEAWREARALLDELDGEQLADTAGGRDAHSRLQREHARLRETLQQAPYEEQRQREATEWLLRTQAATPLSDLCRVLPGRQSSWYELSGPDLARIARETDGTTEWAQQLLAAAEATYVHSWPSSLLDLLDLLPQGLPGRGPKPLTTPIKAAWLTLVGRLAAQTIQWWNDEYPRLRNTPMETIVLDRDHELPDTYHAYRRQRDSILLTAPYCVGLYLGNYYGLPHAVLPPGTPPQAVETCETLAREHDSPDNLASLLHVSTALSR